MRPFIRNHAGSFEHHGFVSMFICEFQLSLVHPRWLDQKRERNFEDDKGSEFVYSTARSFQHRKLVAFHIDFYQADGKAAAGIEAVNGFGLHTVSNHSLAARDAYAAPGMASGTGDSGQLHTVLAITRGVVKCRYAFAEFWIGVQIFQ